LKPAARRQLVAKVRQAHQLTESRACGLIGITRWSNRYEAEQTVDERNLPGDVALRQPPHLPFANDVHCLDTLNRSPRRVK
jgi:hypothetical protein